MALFEKSLEPLTAIGCGLAAVIVGAPDAGLTAAAAVGVAGLVARLRENCEKHGLEQRGLMRKMQIALLRDFDRYDTTQEERDQITLADAAMAQHLPSCMIDRMQLAAISIDADEPYSQKVSRLIADELAKRDSIFAAPVRSNEEGLPRRFARIVIERALAVAGEDTAHASLFAVDLLLEGNRAHAVTHQKLDENTEILRKLLARADLKGVSEETVIMLARRVVETVSDVDDALSQLNVAIDELLDLRARAERGTNLNNLVDEVLRRMSACNAANQFDEAAQEGERVYVDLVERQKAERLTLIEAMIAQSKVRVDAHALANWTFERLSIEQSGSPLGAMLREIKRIDDEARVRPLPLEGSAAVLLAEKALTFATTKEERSAALSAIGATKHNKALHVAGSERAALLAAALAAYKAQLQIIRRTETPLEWASTQVHLGNTLMAQSSSVDVVEGIALLETAGSAFESALEVYERDAMPVDFATTLDSLACALQSLGERYAGDKGARLLTRSINAFEISLEVLTRGATPVDWADAQNNLGNTLRLLGDRKKNSEGTRLLLRAVTAFEEALKVRTKEARPLDWAMTLNNLGTALVSLAERSSGETSKSQLSEAIRVYEASLEVRTREGRAAQWAITQANRGVALMLLGERTEGPQDINFLHAAVEAHESAMEIFTRETAPSRWATFQTNRGVALSILAEKENSIEHLYSAEQALTQAISVLGSGGMEYVRQHCMTALNRVQREIANRQI